VSNSNSTFLLLNNEVQNQTFLSGFTLFGTISGSITIQVKIFRRNLIFLIQNKYYNIL